MVYRRAIVQSAPTCLGEWSREASCGLRIELGAVGAERHDLPVGTAEARERPVPFAAPDDHVLPNVAAPAATAMNRFISGARSLYGEESQTSYPRRFGPRISRTWETSDRSMSVPSTGVDSTHRRMSMPMDFSRISHERVAQSEDVGVGGDVQIEGQDPGYPVVAPEVEVASEVGPVYRHLSDAVHVAVPVDVEQVGQVHRVLRRILGMPGEAEGPDRDGRSSRSGLTGQWAGAIAAPAPSIPHQPKISPAISCVSKTRNRAARGGGA